MSLVSLTVWRKVDPEAEGWSRCRDRLVNFAHSEPV